MQKALEQMNLQLHKVLSDISGVTGFQIIRAIVAGERDPLTLAQMRQAGVKNNEETIAKALTGPYREDHLSTLAQALQTYDFLQRQLCECDRQIQDYMQRQRLCPNNRITGGKIKRRRSRKVQCRAACALRVAAQSLHHSKSALGAFFRRMKARLGPAKAVTATARKPAVLIYRMLKYRQKYVDSGQQSYEQRYQAQREKSLAKQAQSMGYSLVPNLPQGGVS